MRAALVLVLVIVFTTQGAFAEVSEEKELHLALEVAVAEGLFIVNAGFSSASPEVFGVALILLSPLGLSEKASDVTHWITLGSIISLGLYNAVELRKNKYSQSDVFVRNMYAWHAFAAVVYLTERVTGKKKSNSVAIIPIEKGMAAAFSVDF